MYGTLKSTGPEVLTYAPSQDLLLIFVAYMVGLLPFINTDFLLYGIPVVTPGLLNSIMLENNSKLAGYINYYIYILGSRLLQVFGKPMFEHLKKRGAYITMWVANTPEDVYDSMLLYPVLDGVFSDNPSNMTTYL